MKPLKIYSIRRPTPAPFHVIAIATGALVLAVSALANEQPLVNGSFDGGTNTAPDGWKTIGDWKVQTEDQTSFATFTKEGIGDARFLEQIIPIPDGWKNVGLISRVRVSDFSGQNQGGYWIVQFYFQDAAGEKVGEYYMSKNIRVTDGWESLQIPVEPVPENATNISVLAGLWLGEGTMDIDSIALVNGE